MEDFLQENRQLYISQVASFKAPATEDADFHRETDPDTIIAARVRPLLPAEIAAGEVVGVTVRSDTGNVDVHQLRPKFFSNRAPKLILDTSSFPLDRTYGPDQSSEYMYNDLVKPLVPWAWNGGVSTLFAYGQTGSGKTYSVQSLQHLVATDLMNGSLEGDREIKLSICEMIGHKTFDLLNNRHPIKILEDSFGETQLVGVVEHRPKTATEFLSLLDQSTTLRQTEQTLKNDASSRSHAVCRIRVCNPARPSEPDGLIFLVDLAGSEYASDVRFHSASRMKERREINISLSTLKDCIRGRALYNLGGEKKAHVPFRWSLLTKVLKHVFDVKSARACKTVVLACVKPNAGEAPAGKNTLRFAEVLRVRVPKMEPEFCHHEVPRTWSHEYLVEWIKKNSGTPPISATHLAPYETGAQLIKLSKAAFTTRCLKTPLVTEEQARAFYDKLWKLHIDSRNKKPNDLPKMIETNGKLESKIQPGDWRESMRPGMGVRLKRGHQAEPVRHVMVLCPEGAFGNEPGYQEMAAEGKQANTYVCAEILPAVMADAYNLAIDIQSVVSLDEMENEILLEFDHATRFYFINI